MPRSASARCRPWRTSSFILCASAAMAGGACRPWTSSQQWALHNGSAPDAPLSALAQSERLSALRPIATNDGLESLTLQWAIERALAANRGLQGALDGIDASRLSRDAANAEFELIVRPTAGASLSGTTASETAMDARVGVTLDHRFVGGTDFRMRPTVGIGKDRFEPSLQLALSQPLLRGSDMEFNRSALYNVEFSERAAHRTLHLARISTIVQTVTVVYGVVRQRELVRLNEASAERLLQHVEATKAKERIGLATQIDSLRAELQLRQARDGLATAREAYGDSLDDLRVLLALALDAPLDVDAPLVFDRVDLEEDECVEAALLNRVEIDQARDMLNEAHRHSRIARHNTLPELNVVLGYTRFGQDESFARSLSIDRQAWTASLVSTTDLARTAERAAYEQSLLGVRAAARALELQRDDIVRQVKAEVRALRRSDKRISIQQEQVASASAKLELARVKFQHGQANNFDLIEAEAELRRSETDLLGAVINYVIATYRLRAAMGTLLGKPGEP